MTKSVENISKCLSVNWELVHGRSVKCWNKQIQMDCWANSQLCVNKEQRKLSEKYPRS